MKRAISFFQAGLMALLILLLISPACAETQLPAAVTSLFHASHPGYTISSYDQCGHTAAAVLTNGSKHVLCLAEEKEGAWELVVSNPAALRQDLPVNSLLLDTDETLYWSYLIQPSEMETWHAVRSGGQWRLSGMMNSTQHANGNISEYHLWHEEGRLQYAAFFCDENENVQSSREYTPVPAAWVDALLPLNCYDAARFPNPVDDYTHSWLSKEATALAAAELFPDDIFLDGCASPDHLAFFLEKPNGDRIIAACVFDEQNGWTITRSTPLPEGTLYGFENFSSSLVIGELLVNIGPVDGATCGVTHIYNTRDMASGETMFTLGKNRVSGESSAGYQNHFGNHPWGNIATIDWTRLPQSLSEARDMLDTSDWAVVNNPDPADRLHLRTSPQRSAKSLGKYYNGTPVRIVYLQGEWACVDVFGVQGWMMKKYLAFGSAGHAVEAAFPIRMAVENKTDHFVFAQPAAGQPIANYRYAQSSMLVLGIVNEEWYHVWFPQDDLSGYVLQSDWWEGNG